MTTNVYEFQGKDYKHFGSSTSIDPGFIDIGQRERKPAQYDIDKYYRNAFNTPMPNKEKKREKPKGWRALVNGGYEHQFFDIALLDDLEEKENAWNAYLDDKEEHEGTVPAEFTKADQELKDKLLTHGFANWSKKDFFLFIRVNEFHGRDNLQNHYE